MRIYCRRVGEFNDLIWSHNDSRGMMPNEGRGTYESYRDAVLDEGGGS